MKISQLKNDKTIKGIVQSINCKYGFKCLNNANKNICKAESIPFSNLVECNNEHPQKCNFSFSYGEGFYCKCPLRKYLIQSLGI